MKKWLWLFAWAGLCAQIPSDELNHPNTLLLLEASGYDVGQIQKLGDIRNFESPEAFLEARRAYRHKIFAYLDEHPEKRPKGFKIQSPTNYYIAVHEFESIATVAGMLDFIAGFLNHKSDEEVMRHPKMGYHRAGMRHRLISRGFPKEELAALHALTDGPNNLSNYRSRRWREAETSPFALYGKRSPDEIPTRELLELSRYHGMWGDQIESDWALLVLNSLSPTARAVLVSYLFEELTTMTGTSLENFFWGQRTVEEVQGYRDRFRNLEMKRSKWAGEQ